ncbi:MAG: DUF1080 domain-containing protein [Rhodothermales bacterium]|nr:DUF1080 domain-containing protein [Rhodothermales bacterium]
MRKRIYASCLFILGLVPFVSGQNSGSGWTSLFNGRDMTGWEHVGEGNFVVEDGLLKTQGGMGLLWYTTRKLKDEVLRVEYRNVDGSNAGVFIRIPEQPTEPWMPVHRGYEVQIEDRLEDSSQITGVLYSLTEAMARPSRPGEWNVLEIFLDGERTVVTVNGVLVTYFREGDEVLPREATWEPERGPRASEGYIGLQNHSEEDEVYFRSVSVRPLGR